MVAPSKAHIGRKLVGTHARRLGVKGKRQGTTTVGVVAISSHDNGQDAMIDATVDILQIIKATIGIRIIVEDVVIVVVILLEEGMIIIETNDLVMIAKHLVIVTIKKIFCSIHC